MLFERRALASCLSVSWLAALCAAASTLAVPSLVIGQEPLRTRIDRLLTQSQVAPAAAIARLVFPTPPGPTKVTRRFCRTERRTSASSSTRPRNEVRRAGRFPPFQVAKHFGQTALMRPAPFVVANHFNPLVPTA